MALEGLSVLVVACALPDRGELCDVVSRSHVGGLLCFEGTQGLLLPSERLVLWRYLASPAGPVHPVVLPALPYQVTKAAPAFGSARGLSSY